MTLNGFSIVHRKQLKATLKGCNFKASTSPPLSAKLYQKCQQVIFAQQSGIKDAHGMKIQEEGSKYFPKILEMAQWFRIQIQKRGHPFVFIAFVPTKFFLIFFGGPMLKPPYIYVCISEQSKTNTNYCESKTKFKIAIFIEPQFPKSFYLEMIVDRFKVYFCFNNF